MARSPFCPEVGREQAWGSPPRGGGPRRRVGCLSGSPGAALRESSGGGWESRDEDPELGLAPGGSARAAGVSCFPVARRASGPTLQDFTLACWGWTEPYVSGSCGLHLHAELRTRLGTGNDHTERCQVTRQHKSQTQKRLNTDLLQTHTQTGSFAGWRPRSSGGTQSPICCCRVCREKTGQKRHSNGQRAHARPQGGAISRMTSAPLLFPEVFAPLSQPAERGDTTLKIKLGKKTADQSTRLSKFPTSLRSGATPHLVPPGDPQRKGTRRLRCTREAWGPERGRGRSRTSSVMTDCRPGSCPLGDVLISHLVSMLPR